MKKILLGVSGSIACYKAAFLVRQLRRRDIAVQVVLTPSAARLVGAPTFRALSAQPVLQEEWRQPHSGDGMDHIAAVRQADALLIAPASADFIAKAATGIADNLLLASFLAADCPKYVAPAMNQQMWSAAATQRNISRLREDGVHILGPDTGEQACGEQGAGRMLEADEIVAHLLAPRPWAGKRVIVSTGATREKLDAIRIISNRSSGQMGICLAQAAMDLGAEVRLVAAQTTVSIPGNIPLRRALDNEAMRHALLEEAAAADWFFSVAAIADFAPKERQQAKTAREKGEWAVVLTPVKDILSDIAQTYPALNCVAFAAQSGTPAEQEAAAYAKMRKKGTKYIVLNDVADAGSADSQLTVLSADDKQALPRMTKRLAAQKLLNILVSHETINQRQE